MPFLKRYESSQEKYINLIYFKFQVYNLHTENL